MTKRILLFVAMMYCAVSVFAQTEYTDGQGIKYTLDGTTATVSKYTGSSNSIVIPETISSNGVTSIGGNAFYHCEKLASVTIERGDLGELVFGDYVITYVPSNCNIELKYTGTLHTGFAVAFDITAGTGISIDGNKIVFARETSNATLTTKEVSGALSITKSNDGKYVATIDGNSTSSISLSEDIAVSSVTYYRDFRADGGAYTIMLPFDFTVTSDVKGSFYTLSTLEPTETPSVWKANMSDAITVIQAHTPYIFVPSENFSEMTFSDVTLRATTGALLTNACENTNNNQRQNIQSKILNPRRGVPRVRSN